MSAISTEMLYTAGMRPARFCLIRVQRAILQRDVASVSVTQLDPDCL